MWDPVMLDCLACFDPPPLPVSSSERESLRVLETRGLESTRNTVECRDCACPGVLTSGRHSLSFLARAKKIYKERERGSQD